MERRKAQRNLNMRVANTGVQSTFETAIRFLLWARAMHAIPTHTQIQSTFNVSRATAYRWRAGYLAATAQDGIP